MNTLFFLLFALLPLSSHAEDVTGRWEGDGSCYYQHRPQTASSHCHFQLYITKTETDVSILNCLTWRQEWGDGQNCSRVIYEIRNGNELWVRTLRVGSISDASIDIDYTEHNSQTTKYYRLSPRGLIYDAHFTSPGTAEWLFRGDLTRVTAEPK